MPKAVNEAQIKIPRSSCPELEPASLGTSISIVSRALTSFSHTENETEFPKGHLMVDYKAA